MYADPANVAVPAQPRAPVTCFIGGGCTSQWTGTSIAHMVAQSFRPEMLQAAAL